MDEVQARAELERRLLACLGEPRGVHPAAVLDLARHAAHSLYLRDERIAQLEGWLGEHHKAVREEERLSAIRLQQARDISRMTQAIWDNLRCVLLFCDARAFWHWRSEQVSAVWYNLALESDEQICFWFRKSPWFPPQAPAYVTP